MRHKIRSTRLGMLILGVLAATNCGCGGGSASPPPPPISVSLSQITATVQVGATAQFTATVGNDLSNAGVTWTLVQDGTACSPSCGTITPNSTASGAPATYTAPAAMPNPATVTLTATLVADTTKVASSTITVAPPQIGVLVSPPSATVEAGGTLSFTATVTNDPANKGVAWSVTIERCSPLGCLTSHCTTGCGTFSPAGTSSGTPTTYTAPGKLAGRAFVVATSVTNTSASGAASLTVLPISVSVSPTSSSVALNAALTFTATVTGDATNSGVIWSLTQNGVACVPACGMVSPASTASGALTTYTGPSTLPIYPLVTLTATSVEDKTTSASTPIALATSTGAVCADTGSEALLKGQYAFLLRGFDYDIAALAGSFTADGAGKITAGQIDLTHRANAGQLAGVAVESAGSSYSVGPDHRGCLMLANANGGVTFFRFALGSINASNIATKGHIIEFDDTTGGGTRLTGTLRLQDPASFSAKGFNGAYAFGLTGQGTTGDPAAIAGIIDSDGVSAITAGSFDFNDGGKFSSKIPFVPGTPFTCCSTNGRGTIGTGTLQDNGGAWIFNLTMYMINSNEAFLIGSVLYNPTNNCCEADVALGIASGEAFAAPGPFSTASLKGPSVFRQAAQAITGAIFSTATANPVVHIGSASGDGAGTLTINDNENNGGTFSAASLAFTYAVASNGRVTLSGGSTPPVLYLTGQNAGILLGTNTNVDFGIIEPQTGGPFSDSSFSGAYTLGNENPSAISVTMQAGVVTADGNGNAAGTSEQSSLTGLSQNQALNFAYSFPAGGVGNVGNGTTAILISGNKLVFINNTDPNPTITVVEK